MCGIAGLLLQPGDPALATKVERMTARLVHRGPDGEGYWSDTSSGIAFGHRRLAIVDLSPHGRQPMESACGRYVITFNGEIYNHNELRASLPDGIQWRGHSDTEVMLAAISAWGIRAALGRFVGMFAFALWDRNERCLHLVRDRLGEKPLYYGRIDGAFAFASELKALNALRGGRGTISTSAVQALMEFGYVPAPLSIFEDVHKLRPATMLTLRVGADGSRAQPELERYWSAENSRTARRREEYARATTDALVGELTSLIEQAVRGQMVADVPLGAFLSGGIDSSTIVALMQRLSSRPIRTFTIGFDEAAYDEAPYARGVAQYLGTDHSELYVSAARAAEVIPRLPQIYDEPFADSSAIPTFLVAEMTRRHVTVALSGDGGDELFGGYPRYVQGERLWRHLRRLPLWLRGMGARALTLMSASAWDQLLGVMVPNRDVIATSGHRIHRLSRVMRSTSMLDLYRGIVSQWQPADALVLASGQFVRSCSPYESDPQELTAQSPLIEMRGFDLAQYLPDDILAKVDRASMSVSLESRAPLLDHRLAEFAWALPPSALVRDGKGKWLLRRVLERLVSPELTERPKSGFAIPVNKWLRNELRPWAEDLLDVRRLRREGHLNHELVQRMWQEHLRGTHDRQAYLWNVLMFQAWLDTWHRAS
jgi:asparagine synthase (glutamine-hydrolysing)